MKTLLMCSLLAAAALALHTGCSDNCGLGGTAVGIYDMSYDSILIQRQEEGGQPQAMIVSYLRGGGAEKPMKVVASFPLEEGEQKSLTDPGTSVEHHTVDGGDITFVVTNGFIRFDSLGAPGDSASGEFFATFDVGATINGCFSGTVQRLSFDPQ